MSPWIETVTACLLALAGAWLGVFLSRKRKPLLLAGYSIPMALVGLAIASRWYPEIALHRSLSWLLEGQRRWALLGFTAPAVLLALRSGLGRRSERVWVTILASILVGYALSPFIVFAAVRGRLLALPTRLDPNGVCRQGTGYTCGPAAAVTALRRLGFEAEEGELAALFRTTPTSGTGVETLVLRLRDRYGSSGLSVEYRRFDDVGDLPVRSGPAEEEVCTILPVRHGILVDHYVTVLGRDEERVTVGDPLVGLRMVSRDELRRWWRSSGVVLRRMNPP